MTSQYKVWARVGDLRFPAIPISYDPVEWDGRQMAERTRWASVGANPAPAPERGKNKHNQERRLPRAVARRAVTDCSSMMD
jgi:hypothetical protein